MCLSLFPCGGGRDPWGWGYFCCGAFAAAALEAAAARRRKSTHFLFAPFLFRKQQEVNFMKRLLGATLSCTKVSYFRCGPQESGQQLGSLSLLKLFLLKNKYFIWRKRSNSTKAATLNFRTFQKKLLRGPKGGLGAAESHFKYLHFFVFLN